MSKCNIEDEPKHGGTELSFWNLLFSDLFFLMNGCFCDERTDGRTDRRTDGRISSGPQ